MPDPAGQPAPAPAPAGTVTFLFTDIEGSSRLWEQHPALMPAVIARHLGDLSRLIAARHGFVFKTMGDQVCAAMPAALDAARAALDIQRHLIAADPDLGAPVRTRIALHTGPAELRAGDYFGRAVNRVARLLSAGHGGQTLVSQATSSLLEGELPAGASMADLGVHRLRDLQGDERIYQLSDTALRSEFPPLRTLNARTTNLPAQLSAFLGRARELRDTARALDGARLVTLTGPGGVGKTRLAIQTAASAAARVAGGVWLVELAGVQQAADVAGAIASALSIREAGADGALAAAAAKIADQPLLLVLDNCEQVLEAASGAARTLLGACPNLRIVATSRAPLHVPGEQVLPLSPLPLPESDDLAALESSDAVRLLAERARLASPSFSLDQASAPHLARICRALDGLPLAIELAAARVAGMDLSTLAARLEQRVGTLAAMDPGAPQRQRTVSASIEWSYRLLSLEQQTLLARLSVFAGGWTLGAAEAVCAAPPIERDQVAELLAALVNCSMVSWHEAEPGEGGAPGRYRMLHPVVEFARERLAAQAGGAHDDATAHLLHFVGFAETHGEKLAGPGQAHTLTVLARELDNLRAAFAHALAPGSHDDSALRLAVAMGPFFYQRGLISEGRSWIARGLRHAPERQDRLHARALNWAGAFAWAQSDRAVARTMYEQAIESWTRLGDRRALAGALTNVGNLAHDTGDVEGAISNHEQARAIYRDELGDALGTAYAELNICAPFSTQGRWREMLDLLRRCRTMFEGRDDFRLAVTTRNLAEVHWRLGQPGDALAAMRQSLATRIRIGDLRGGIPSLVLAAAIANQCGEPTAAARILGGEQALRAAHGTAPAVLPGSEEVLCALGSRLAPAELSTHLAQGRAIGSLAGMLDMLPAAPR